MNTGSVEGGTGWYSVVPGQNRAVLDAMMHDELSENIWFAWSKSSNYLIFEEGKSDYGHTHRQNFLL